VHMFFFLFFRGKFMSGNMAAPIADNVSCAVGHTPLVLLNRVSIGCVARVVAKLESKNPGGSVKDRIAVSMIEAAEDKGQITPGKTILIEATSGNTGVGLAMVAAAKGYKLILTMPRTPNMTERYMLCRAYGAEVHLSDPYQGAAGFVELAKEIADKTPDSFLLSQFTNQSNPQAHQEGTGPEIWAATEGQVDALVCGAGTGGTVVGAGQYLKSMNPNLHLVCVEANESRVLQGAEVRPQAHGLLGIRLLLNNLNDLSYS
jgi:cysteine synthase A